MKIKDIINLFGGVSKLSRTLGVTASSITHWTTRKKIPTAKQIQLIRLAKNHNKELQLSDFD